MAYNRPRANQLLEAESSVGDGQLGVDDFGLGLSNQAALMGLDVVHQVGLQLQHRRSPGALAQEVIRILENTLGYDNAAILLVDQSARQLKPFALSEKGYGNDFGQAYDTYVATHDLRLGVGLAGRVALHGHPLLSGDVQREAPSEGLYSEVRSALVVPILVEGVVIGTIGLESRLVDAFTQIDRQLLETVAGQIAIAFQNAHLFSRVRREDIESLAKGELLSEESEPSSSNGSRHFVLDSSPPAEDTDEIATKAAGAIEKVTMTPDPAPNTENQIQDVIADYRAQIEELNAFNHTVAHDLKNPLSILLGFAEILAQDRVSGEDELLNQAIRVIIENGRRMENIINELLLLAEVRIVEQIPLEPLDMSTVVVETCKRLSSFIKEYQAEIVLPESWPIAMGHQPWVEEIWVNYLSNAIKYGGRSPRVELGGEVLSENAIRFWVRDFGDGISDADQDRLFIPFAKLQQANTKGHGLGLSIVQRIAKRLGGQVGVESEQGKGSLFWFTLAAA